MKHQRKLFIITLFVSLTAFCLFAYITNEEQVLNSDITEEIVYPQLIIDAGHGGEDGGAVAADGTAEKNINLNIATQVNCLLKLMGIQSVMIREEDVDLADHALPTVRKRKISDINARYELINAHPEGVYISIHQNQFADRTVHGLQVFFSENHAISKALAESVQCNANKILQNDNHRKIKPSDSNVYLLYHAKIPAIMVECGFMSNPDELRKLKSTSYGMQIALVIAGGFLYYNDNKGVS